MKKTIKLRTSTQTLILKITSAILFGIIGMILSTNVYNAIIFGLLAYLIIPFAVSVFIMLSVSKWLTEEVVITENAIVGKSGAIEAKNTILRTKNLRRFDIQQNIIQKITGLCNLVFVSKANKTVYIQDVPVDGETIRDIQRLLPS